MKVFSLLRSLGDVCATSPLHWYVYGTDASVGAARFSFNCFAVTRIKPDFSLSSKVKNACLWRFDHDLIAEEGIMV